MYLKAQNELQNQLNSTRAVRFCYAHRTMEGDQMDFCCCNAVVKIHNVVCARAYSARFCWNICALHPYSYHTRTCTELVTVHNARARTNNMRYECELWYRWSPNTVDVPGIRNATRFYGIKYRYYSYSYLYTNTAYHGQLQRHRALSVPYVLSSSPRTERQSDSMHVRDFGLNSDSFLPPQQLEPDRFKLYRLALSHSRGLP